MSNELEIATRYFINKLQPDTLKLQKLLYFAQGASFCINDEELFPEEIEAWVHGPVVPVVYHKYKKHGYNPITTKYDIQGITEAQLEVLNTVVDAYGMYDGRQLEEITHRQTPWKYARQGLDPDERSDKTIPKDVICEYFLGLMFQPREEA